MNLAEKIIKLRKSQGLSQEELADRLGISRQAVSKWESEQSMPDIDKIILLSDYFGVTTDYLLKDSTTFEEKNLTRDTDLKEDTTEATTLNTDITGKILNAKYREAKLIALAVAIFILSPLTLISLCIVSELGYVNQFVAVALGLVVLFFLVTLGIGLCIYSNFLTAPYRLKDKNFILSESAADFIEKEKAINSKRNLKFYIFGITLTVLSPLPLIVYSILSEFWTVSVPHSKLLAILLSVLFVFVSIGVSLLCNAGMRDEAFAALTPKKHNTKSGARTVIDIYWTALPFIYLLISFLTGRWDITWLIWPLSPIIPEIIGLISRKK